MYIYNLTVLYSFNRLNHIRPFDSLIVGYSKESQTRITVYMAIARLNFLYLLEEFSQSKTRTLVALHSKMYHIA